MTTSAQADRLAISTFRPPHLPDPVVPASRACRRRNRTRHGAASSNGPRSTGWVMDVTEGPARGSRRRAGRCPAPAARTGWPGRQRSGRRGPRPGRCPARIRSRGSCAVTSAMVWPRARRSRARQPHRSTIADMTCEPGSPTASAMSGQAASLRSTRTFARRRRCAHHGTASTRPPMASSCGSGAGTGRPPSRRPASRPPRRWRGRVDPLGEGGQSQPLAERRRASLRRLSREDQGPPAGTARWACQPASASAAMTASGASSER